MKAIASLLPVIFTGSILLAALVLLAASRLEYCGQPEALRPRIDSVATAGTRWPTPAPPKKVVFVRIETDRPDLEIGWAEN